MINRFQTLLSNSFCAATSRAAAAGEPHLPHVKNWLRTKHAILFRLSNRTIQVNFQDGSEVLLSSEAAATVFTSKVGSAPPPLFPLVPRTT
jgi:polo-like kinase 1